MTCSFRVIARSFSIVAAGLLTGPFNVSAQSLKEQLVGTWRVVSWTRLVGDSEEPGALGNDPVGLLMYTADGFICANGMQREGRAKFKTSDFRAGSTEEKAAAFGSYFGYCGRFEINESERSVIHKIEVSSFPNFTGGAEKRFIEISGDRLKLTSAPMVVGERRVIHVLLWERAK